MAKITDVTIYSNKIHFSLSNDQERYIYTHNGIATVEFKGFFYSFRVSPSVSDVLEKLRHAVRYVGIDPKLLGFPAE